MKVLTRFFCVGNQRLRALSSVIVLNPCYSLFIFEKFVLHSSSRTSTLTSSTVFNRFLFFLTFFYERGTGRGSRGGQWRRGEDHAAVGRCQQRVPVAIAPLRPVPRGLHALLAGRQPQETGRSRCPFTALALEKITETFLASFVILVICPHRRILIVPTGSGRVRQGGADV